MLFTQLTALCVLSQHQKQKVCVWVVNVSVCTLMQALTYKFQYKSISETPLLLEYCSETVQGKKYFKNPL